MQEDSGEIKYNNYVLWLSREKRQTRLRGEEVDATARIFVELSKTRLKVVYGRDSSLLTSIIQSAVLRKRKIIISESSVRVWNESE